MKNRPLTWEIKKAGDGSTLVIFEGVIDERSTLDALGEPLQGKVTFDLAAVRRINSEGVRRWMLFLRGLSRVTELVFVRCSIVIVTQLNMISGFQCNAEIRSFFAPYLCTKTGQEEERLILTKDITDPRHPPTFPCEGGVLELDDIPERYLAFLLDEL
jgi:hypothetical protein